VSATGMWTQILNIAPSVETDGDAALWSDSRERSTTTFHTVTRTWKLEVFAWLGIHFSTSSNCGINEQFRRDLKAHLFGLHVGFTVTSAPQSK